MPNFTNFIKSAFQLIFLFSCAFSAAAKEQIPSDSIRREIYKNHPVMIYRVSSKETIYSISRKYNVSPKEVILLNDGHQSLRVGDEIRIPLKGQAVSEQNKSGIVTSSPVEQSYTVEKKETVYSIARKFGMQPAEVEKINALTNTVLKPGQLLTIIPYKKNESSVIKTQTPILPKKPDNQNEDADQKSIEKPIGPEKKPNIPATGLYIVQTGETVFSISTRYGIPVARIDELNHLANNGIHAGETLKLIAAAAEPVSKAKPDENDQQPAEQHKPAPASTPIHVPSVDTPKPVRQPEIILAQAEQPASSNHISKEYKEEGLGLWLNNNDLNQARSVGLHKTAPVGTIVKVTNPMSRKSIFIKIVGSFPVTAESKDAMIIISKSAAELIGALDQRFRVELSYAY